MILSRVQRERKGMAGTVHNIFHPEKSLGDGVGQGRPYGSSGNGSVLPSRLPESLDSRGPVTPVRQRSAHRFCPGDADRELKALSKNRKDLLEKRTGSECH